MAKRYRLRTQLRAHAPHHVARESRVGVTVGADDRAGLQQRLNIAFQAVGEIGGVDEAESGGREHLLLFAAPCGLLDERGGVPFTERDGVALRAQPLAQERKLSGLTRTINPFHYDQFALESIRNEDRHKFFRTLRAAAAVLLTIIKRTVINYNLYPSCHDTQPST